MVLLHSIDGPNIMSPDSQEKLCDLLDNEHIQLICSLDSIKMVMNWSPSIFSFIFSYFAEISVFVLQY